MNAGKAATNAARLRAAAAAASLRIGHASVAQGTDKNERQTVHQSSRASNVPFAGRTESRNENRVRAVIAFERQGPSPLFMTQKIAQETLVTGGFAVNHMRAVNAYRSLEIEQELFLPGEDVALLVASARVDHHIVDRHI